MMRSGRRLLSSDGSTGARAGRVKGIVAGLGVVLGASVSAAACGSIEGNDLFTDGTTGSSSSGGIGGSGGSTSSSTTSSSGVLPTCGNGELDTGEACDGADVGGATCTSLGFASPGTVTCTAACELDTSACKATCDGAQIEPGEDCDGTLLGGHSCVEFGFSQAEGLTCKSCQLDPSTCKATCNDGEIEPGETCDGASLGGKTCADFGFTNPSGLKCLPDCSGVDASGCKATCGNDLLEKGEICEGANLNGKTCVDAGFVNPAGLKCTGCQLDATGCKAVCGNGKIEPGEDCDDGNTTGGDGCAANCKQEMTPGSTCGGAIAVNVAAGSTTITGSTIGGGKHTGSTCDGADASDRVYALTMQASGYLTVSLSRAQTNFDSVLYISQGCSDTADNTTLLCADSYDVGNTALNGGELVSIRVQQGQKYFVFVDGYANGDAGNYQMVVDLSSGTDCNDPVPIQLEPGTPMTVLGTNNNGNATAQGTCGGQPGGHTVYRITRSNAGSIGVDTDDATTNYNSVLYARSICVSPAPELACSNQGGTAGESITLNNVQANTPVYVYVDGSQTGGGSANGSYGLILTP
ncbi:Fibro-slime domain protein [Minicystis rosea]|nr:Fibro-slime domain protein [Minicystis rosea]